jgi:menaquinone-dependent protoporphyrinogen oxidase
VTTLSDIQVLVSAGSKHGASAEIADSIGETLAGRGFDVTVAKPEEVTDVAGYQAVVLGSAVYAGHWTDPANDLAQRVAAADPKPAVWLFSSGPLGDPPKPEEDPVDVSEIVEANSARGHRVFSGKIDSASARRRS